MWVLLKFLEFCKIVHLALKIFTEFTSLIKALNEARTDPPVVKINTEYRNQGRINVHAHLLILFYCHDVIIEYVGNLDHRSNLT